MTLKDQFHEDMLNIYNEEKKIIHGAEDLGKMLHNLKGLKTAKFIVQKITGGFKELNKINRLDLSVEYLVLNSKYRELFSDDERNLSRTRLVEHGFDVSKIK